MDALIRGFDWASTPLGPMDDWPMALRAALGIAEHSAFPTAIYWGPDLRLIYNDGWAPFLAERHPAALGQPAQTVWSDIWSIMEPRFAQVLEEGRAYTNLRRCCRWSATGPYRKPTGTMAFADLRRGRSGRRGFQPGDRGNEGGAQRAPAFLPGGARRRIRGLRDPVEMKTGAAALLGNISARRESDLQSR
jgi:hypothetical protein